MKPKINEIKEEFEKAMDDDLNTGKAVNLLLQFSKDVNKSLDNKKSILNEAGETLKELGRVLGLKLDLSKKEDLTGSEELIDLIVKIREDLRNNEEYELSDRIRSGLKEIGIELQDTKEGVKWRKI